MTALSQENLWNMYDEIENTFEDKTIETSSKNEEETRCIKCNFICDFKRRWI